MNRTDCVSNDYSRLVYAVVHNSMVAATGADVDDDDDDDDLLELKIENLLLTSDSSSALKLENLKKRDNC